MAQTQKWNNTATTGRMKKHRIQNVVIIIIKRKIKQSDTGLFYFK